MAASKESAKKASAPSSATSRALVRSGAGWQLRALNPAYPAIDLAGLDAVRGVVIQKSKPGRRRATKHYV
jgi:SOS-response transcriptional repressor LexA